MNLDFGFFQFCAFELSFNPISVAQAVQICIFLQGTLFSHKHKVYKHTQPHIRELLSTLLSTPPASDFEIGKYGKIFEKFNFFFQNLKTKPER